MSLAQVRYAVLDEADRMIDIGFRDDIVIRIRPDGSGSKVDIRSKSRVGRSDLGVNARRIRELIDEHPHAVSIASDRPRELAGEFLRHDDVVSLRFEGDQVVVNGAGMLGALPRTEAQAASYSGSAAAH